MTEDQIQEVVRRIRSNYWAKYETGPNEIVDDVRIDQSIEQSVRTHIVITETICEVLIEAQESRPPDPFIYKMPGERE